MKISDSTSISMPMRNLLSIVAAVAVGVWAYFGVIERLNKLETQSVLIEKDMTAEDERLHSEVTKNTEFRIKYPRGELGQSSQDIEQFMLIEDLYTTVDRMQKHLDSMANNPLAAQAQFQTILQEVPDTDKKERKKERTTERTQNNEGGKLINKQKQN